MPKLAKLQSKRRTLSRELGFVTSLDLCTLCAHLCCADRVAHHGAPHAARTARPSEYAASIFSECLGARKQGSAKQACCSPHGNSKHPLWHTGYECCSVADTVAGVLKARLLRAAPCLLLYVVSVALRLRHATHCFCRGFSPSVQCPLTLLPLMLATSR